MSEEVSHAKSLRYFRDLIFMFLFMFLCCLLLIVHMESKHKDQVLILREMVQEVGAANSSNNTALCDRMKLLEDIGYKNDWTLTELVTKMGLGTDE